MTMNIEGRNYEPVELPAKETQHNYPRQGAVQCGVVQHLLSLTVLS